MSVRLGSPRLSGVRLALAVSMVLALLAVLLPATATPADASTDAARRMVRLINAERAEAGLRPLRVNDGTAVVARRWSKQMTSERRLYHRPNLRNAINRNVTTRWTRIGENVGFSRVSGATEAQLVQRLHRAFMNSSGHRRNVLGDYNRVGVGVVVDRQGTMWMTVNFVKVR